MEIHNGLKNGNSLRIPIRGGLLDLVGETLLLVGDEGGVEDRCVCTQIDRGLHNDEVKVVSMLAKGLQTSDGSVAIIRLTHTNDHFKKI